MDQLTEEELEVLRKVILSHEVQLLIGAEEWDLTENEEMILWEIINKVEKGG